MWKNNALYNEMLFKKTIKKQLKFFCNAILKKNVNYVPMSFQITVQKMTNPIDVEMRSIEHNFRFQGIF